MSDIASANHEVKSALDSVAFSFTDFEEPVYREFPLIDAPLDPNEIEPEPDDGLGYGWYYEEERRQEELETGWLSLSEEEQEAILNEWDQDRLRQAALAEAVDVKPYVKKPIPAELRWAVFRRDGYRCVRCNYDADLTADHIEAEVKGGRTGIDNLQTLCRRCNSKKGAR
jgi:hypothetical protein